MGELAYKKYLWTDLMEILYYTVWNGNKRLQKIGGNSKKSPEINIGMTL